jgi:hypothetical protein
MRVSSSPERISPDVEQPIMSAETDESDSAMDSMSSETELKIIPSVGFFRGAFSIADWISSADSP